MQITMATEEAMQVHDIYAFATVAADLSGIGMQKVKPVGIQITVNASLFPFSERGVKFSYYIH